MKIGGVHFRTGDDADIQADMNMAEILSGYSPILRKLVIQFILC